MSPNNKLEQPYSGSFAAHPRDSCLPAARRVGVKELERWPNNWGLVRRRIMNTWIVIMIAGLASMGIPVLSFAAPKIPPPIGPPEIVEAEPIDPTKIMEGVHIDPAKKSDVDKRIKDCTVPEGARGFWAGADFGKNFSIGSSVQTQLIRYDITKGKASLNSQGIGGGITLRYYNDGWMAP